MATDHVENQTIGILVAMQRMAEAMKYLAEDAVEATSNGEGNGAAHAAVVEVDESLSSITTNLRIARATLVTKKRNVVADQQGGVDSHS